MSEFVVLTEVSRDRGAREVIINKRHIVFIGKSPTGTDTYVKYDVPVNGNPAAGNHVFVKETVEELKKLLGIV